MTVWQQPEAPLYAFGRSRLSCALGNSALGAASRGIGRTLLQCHIKPEHFIYYNLVWTGFWQWLGLGKYFMTSTRKVGMLLCRGKQQLIKIIITQGHSDKSNQTSKIRYTG